MTMMDDETLRRLLAAAPPGPWRTMQSYAGPWWVGRTGPCGCQRPDCDRGFTVVDDEHGAELAAAAPALAAAVLRLRAVIEGRVVPPTPKEIEAHRAEGGRWLVLRRSTTGDYYPDVDSGPGAVLCDGATPCRWWPLDAEGRPCPWPKVKP